jgi:hypothetical protein
LAKAIVWRVFPYDPKAPRGSEFSASREPAGQGAGRFDIPDVTPVWYFAESPEHAVGEVLQGLRNQPLDANDLIRFGNRLALVAASVDTGGAERCGNAFLDLCDPTVLSSRHIRPDSLASFDFAKTQSVARQLCGAGAVGFRWWSALSGDWHSTILFDVHCRGVLRFRTPEVLTIRAPAVIEAAKRLAMQIV